MVVRLPRIGRVRPHTGAHDVSEHVLAGLTLALALVVGACGGTQKEKDAAPEGPDRGSFEPITPAGIAAVVDEYFGDRVASYSVFTDEPSGEGAERTVEVTLEDVDERDTFLVSVYPEGGSRGQVAKGTCDQAQDQADPQAEVTCFPGPEGGNVPSPTSRSA